LLLTQELTFVHFFGLFILALCLNAVALFCAGVEARDVLSKTSLPVKTLAQIW